MFWDQTLATTRKAQAKDAPKETQAGTHASTSPPKKPQPDASPDDAAAAAPVALILRHAAARPESTRISLYNTSLSVIPEDLATTFFLTAYAAASPTAHLPDLADTLANEGLSTSALHAPALAALSRELVQPSLMALARRHYSTAIQQTSLALASPQLAVKDATLASVLLLALFEALTFQGRRSPTNWTMHMNGATELLQLRGPGQFRTVLGRSMFLDITNDILTSCANRHVAPPPALAELLTQLADVVGHDDLHVRITRATAGMADLVSVVTGGGDPDSVALQVVLRGRQLDAHISELLEQFAALRPYVVLDPASAPDSAYNKIAHHYSSPKLCWQWNNLRMMRVFVNSWVFRAAAAAKSALRDSPEALDVLEQSRVLRIAASNVERMATDILGTVSYCHGLPALSNYRLTMARWLIWPLSAVATSQVAPITARIYARDNLHAFGRETGTSQAMEAGKMVDESKEIEDWWVSEMSIYILTYGTVSLILATQVAYRSSVIEAVVGSHHAHVHHGLVRRRRVADLARRPTAGCRGAMASAMCGSASTDS